MFTEWSSKRFTLFSFCHQWFNNESKYIRMQRKIGVLLVNLMGKSQNPLKSRLLAENNGWRSLSRQRWTLSRMSQMSRVTCFDLHLQNQRGTDLVIYSMYVGKLKMHAIKICFGICWKALFVHCCPRAEVHEAYDCWSSSGSVWSHAHRRH